MQWIYNYNYLIIIILLLQNTLREALADVYFEIVVEEVTAGLHSIGILQLVSMYDRIVEVNVKISVTVKTLSFTFNVKLKLIVLFLLF